mgnify:CR=1 FL=1
MASPATPYLLTGGTKPMTGSLILRGGLSLRAGQKLELVGPNGQIISFSATASTILVKNETTGQILVNMVRS